MKLHLPKQLFSALLSAITLAATPTAWSANDLGINRADNFWAADYAFSFILNDAAFANGNTVVLGKYYGGSPNDGQGANAIVAIKNGDSISLQIGQGGGSDFAFYDNGVNSQTFTGLQTGVVYTLDVAGASGKMNPILRTIAAGTMTDLEGTYNGNMNGNAAISSEFKSSVATLVSASGADGNVANSNILVWAGAAAEGATSASWGTWNSINGTTIGATADAYSILYFDTTSKVAKTVDISDSISVASIKVYDNYTFNATTATTLTTTSGLTIASGKELTLQGADITLSGTIANNGTLVLKNKATLNTNSERALGKMALHDGSTLEIFNQGGGRVVNISDLAITGSATVATTKNSACHQGTINISDLSGTEATLVLKNGSQTGATTLFNLGDSNEQTSFDGTIWLQGAADTGSIRRVALNINDVDIAKGAVIEFCNDSNNHSVLGIGASKVQVAGLQDVNNDGTLNATGTANVSIYGYKIAGGAANFNRDSTDTDQQSRTLEITGAGTYATNAAINDGLNIIMNNAAGSQTFKGSANLGTVTVDAGSLTFSGATTLGGDVDNTGTLTFSGAVTIASGAEISITSADDSVTTFSNTLSGGKLTVSAGTVSYTEDADKGYKVLDTVISSGATLEMKEGDSIDYGSTQNMTMTVEGTLDFGTTGRQTLGANFSLELKDGAVVTGGDGYGGLDFDGSGGSITSNGSATIQNGAIRLRNEDVKIDVQSGTLTTGTIVHNATNATADIIKDGEGTLKITSMAQGGVNGSYQEVFFDGATTLKAGTVEYALTAAGTYNGTITGTGNIKNSGSAAVTLANIQNLTGTIQVDAGTLNITTLTNLQGSLVNAGTLNITTLTNLQGSLEVNAGTLKITTLTNLQGSLDVNAGTLNIATLNALKTITVNIEEGATLSLGTVVVNPDTQSLTKLEDTSFYSIDGATESTNGYLVQTGKYVLFDGYQWQNGSVSGYNLSLDATKNQTHLSINGVKGTTFFVNDEFSSSDITGDAIATKYHVNADGEFTIAGDVTGGKTAAELLSSTTGTGTMILDTDVTISGSDNGTVFEGTLKLDGSDLTGDSYRTLTVGGDPTLANSVASLKEIVLAGQSKIQIKSNPVSETDIQKLTVAENGKGQLYFEDTNGAAMLIGELQLKSGSGFTLGGKWQDSAITIGKLSGSGSFTYESPSQSRQQVTIDSLLGFTGDMVLDNSSAAGGYSAVINTGTTGAVDFSSLTAKGSGTVLNVQSNTTVDTIDAGSGVVNFSAGTMLTLGGDTTSTSTIGTVTANAAGNTIHLNSTATLGRLATVNGGTITLTGSGTYDLGNSTSDNVSGLDDSSKWNGTVKLSNIDAAPDGGFDFDSYGNAQSQVQLSGVKGWIGMNHVDTDTNLHLVNGEGERNYGLNLHATSPKTYQFDGAISGSGDLWVGNEGGDNHLSRTFTFNGDLSAWDGKLVFGADETATVNLNGHAKDGDSGSGITLFSSENGGLKTSTNQTAVLNVNIGTNGYTTTMNGGIVHEGSGNLNLTVKGNTTFNADVKATKLVVDAGKTAEVGGESNSITAGQVKISQKEATLSNVTVEGASMAATSTANGAKGSISNALIDLQNATSFSISDMTLSNVSLKAAAAGTELSLSNVDAQEVELAAGQFTVTLSVQEPAAKSGGYTASFSSDQLSGITLNNAGGAATLTVDLGSLPESLMMGQTYDELTITLNGFTMDTTVDYEAGKGLIFAEDSWLGRMLKDQNAVYVNGGMDSRELAALANNNTVKVEFTSAVENGANVGTVIRITGLTIPEPATTTLGLVALAALVTRRRRK